MLSTLSLRSTPALLLLLAVGCGPRATESPSSPEGLVKLLDEALPIPRAKSGVIMRAVRTDVLTRVLPAATLPSKASLRANLGAALLDNIAKVDGIPRYQQETMLRTVVKGGPEACGGANCSLLFGMTEKEVPAFFDELRETVRTNPELRRPEHQELRRTLLASLKEVEDPREGPLGRGAFATFDFVKSALGSAVSVGHPDLPLHIEISPHDLLKATSVACLGNICETELIKPVKIKMDIPVNLMAQLKVTYEQSHNLKGNLISQEAKVDFKIKPISFADVLSVEVDFVAGLEKGTSTAEKIVIKDVNCTGTVSCSTPFFSVDARMDKHGIEFEAHANSPDLHLGDFLKSSPNLPEFKASMKYSEVPEHLKTLLDHIAKMHLPEGHPDIRWDQITFD